MNSKKYSVSFSVGGGFFYNESIMFAELFENLQEWQEVRSKVEDENLLQARTRSTAGRFFREISSRLQELTHDELRILLDGTHQEKNHIIWLAVCKRYRFLREFAVEVVREKYLNLKEDLSLEDFNRFYDEKAEWNEELERLSLATRKKVQSAVFKILRQAGIITENNKIITTVLSPRVHKTIRENSFEYLDIFPMASA